MSEWQPIETAPIGPVLVWDGEHVSVAEKSITFGREWYGLVCDDYVHDGSGDYAPLYEVMPTHWMPLPDPPK